MLSVTLTRSGGIVRGNWTPVRLEDPGIPEPDPTKASLTLVNDLSKDDFGATAARFTSAGALVVPR